MKILFVNEQYCYMGGTEQYIIETSRLLEKRGIEVAILYGKQAGRPVLENRESYYLPSLNQSIYQGNQIAKDLDRILQRVTPDIIYLHNLENSKAIDHMRRFRPTVRYLHDHRLFCPYGRKIFPRTEQICYCRVGISCVFNAYWQRCLPRRPDRLVAMLRQKLKEIEVNKKLNYIFVASNYMRKCLLQNGFSPKQVQVLPYFALTPPKNTVGVELGDFILFVGRLYQVKGLQCLIESMRLIEPPLRLLVIGEGPYLDEAKRKARKLNLEERIDFLGWVNHTELERYYRSCLTVVLPSIWAEPFGIVGIETMSYGKPVVAFDVGGHSDWLTDGTTGFLVKRKDVSRLAGRIMTLFEDRQLAKKMGEKARTEFEKRFTEQNHLERLLGFFNRIKD